MDFLIPGIFLEPINRELGGTTVLLNLNANVATLKFIESAYAQEADVYCLVGTDTIIKMSRISEGQCPIIQGFPFSLKW